MAGTKHSKKGELSEQKKLFCKYYAEGKSAVQAAILAGYSEKTATVKPYIWLENSTIKNTIEHYKQKAQQHIEKKFCYSIEESFKKLQEIQELAYEQDINGKYYNLTVAAKVEELKGKLAGLYVEKQQIDGLGVNITFNRNYD